MNYYQVDFTLASRKAGRLFLETQCWFSVYMADMNQCLWLSAEAALFPRMPRTLRGGNTAPGDVLEQSIPGTQWAPKRRWLN